VLRELLQLEFGDPNIITVVGSRPRVVGYFTGNGRLVFRIALLTEHLGLSIEMGHFVAGLMISGVCRSNLTYVETIADNAPIFCFQFRMLIDPVFLWNNLGELNSGTGSAEHW